MPFNYYLPYPSRRSPVMGMRGAVATSHPLAAQAGLKMLMEGGNAVDAALAAAAALVVLEPTSNGLGSDAFCLLWENGRLHGLNASGRSPQALTAGQVRKMGHDRMPVTGWLPVTVPGAVSGWVALSQRFGSMPLSRVVQPAVDLAENGFPVPPVISGYWRASEKRFKDNRDFANTFLLSGRAPKAGEVFHCPDLGRSLRMIAESAGEEFYRGGLAAAIATHSRNENGFLTAEDLANHKPDWVEPICTDYRGYTVWEIPPNGQGLAALMALNILEGYDLGSYPQLSAKHLHVLTEALRLSFADAHAYIADPSQVRVPTSELLDKAYAAKRRSAINPSYAMEEPGPGLYGDSDTVYLCAADGNGMMVSFIQSNYMGFGSGVVVPGTGISLQNRGAGFSLEPDHPNGLAPGKRPFHTIIPGFVTKDGEALCAFGVMGGDMQPQGHVQVVSGIVDYGLNPQAAMDCPRLRVMPDKRVAVETGINPEVVRQLARLGHMVHLEAEMAGFGGGQIIWRDPATRVLIAGSEPRKDGQAVVW